MEHVVSSKLYGDQACALVLKAAYERPWSEARYVDGIGTAAEALGLAASVSAFTTAVREALDQVGGVPPIHTWMHRAEASRVRATWEAEVIRYVAEECDGITWPGYTCQAEALDEARETALIAAAEL